MNNFKAVFGSLRPPFLILTPACVSLGVATAAASTKHLPIVDILLVFIGAVCAHIAVNCFNEYRDFKTGLDDKTQRTPFSGGSGSLQKRPDLANLVLGIALVSCFIIAVIGIYFVIKQGPGLLPIGVLGLIILYAYTRWIVYQPFLSLIAPGLGFGTLMVLGTQFSLTGKITSAAVVASMIPFFLVSNLLLLNQFPDVEADQSIGKRTYPVVIGRRKSSIIYIAFLALAYVAIVVGVVFKLFPAWGLLGFLTLPISIKAGLDSFLNSDNIEKLIPSMGLNVIVNILTPVFLAIGIFIGRA